MILRRLDNRFVNRAIVITAVTWLILAVGFGLYYYFDRYGQRSSPLVETEIQRLQKAVASDPTNLDAFVTLGTYYLETNQVDQAIQETEKVLVIDPNHQNALFVTAKAYLAKNDDDMATERLERLVSLNKDAKYAKVDQTLGIALYYLGEIHLKRQQFAEAEGRFRAALSILNMDADVYLGLGRALAGQKEYSEAIDAFRSSLRFDPGYVAVYPDLAEAYQKAGMLDHAAYARAMQLYGQGEYARASDELRRVTEALPQFADAFRGLGMSLEMAGRRDEAIAAYRKALELDPTDRASVQALGRLSVLKP